MLTKDEFTRLAVKYQNMIYRLALSYLRSPCDAEDITQDVLIKLYTEKKDFESDDHVRFWLVRVTVNECKKAFRRRHITPSLDECAELIAEDDSEAREVFEAVMSLDDKLREVIVLHYYQGLKIAQIARIVKIPQGTVGTRLKRAKEKLYELLGEGL
ncbi:MAG: sigma-70 family RNA polymerase sigma factor [Clostridia bacterium]|nr:sigma-70 family RNA polymerase sigma factor [Clostridia bacterium]